MSTLRFNGTTDRVRGTGQGTTLDNGTVAVIIHRVGDTSHYEAFIGGATSGNVMSFMLAYDQQLLGVAEKLTAWDGTINRFNVTTTPTANSDWWLIAFTKGPNAATGRFHMKNLTTNAAWVHETSTGDNNFPSMAGGYINLGNYSTVPGNPGILNEGFNGDIGLVGWWEDNALSDVQIEALAANKATSDWWNSDAGRPSSLTEVTSLAPTDLAGVMTWVTTGAGLTGTVPTGWTFDGAGAPDVSDPAPAAPPNAIIENYSGIVVNQNQRPASPTDYITLDSSWLYQEVFLPTDYIRGQLPDEQIIPPLSGWQLLVGVDPNSEETASLEWVAQYQIFGVGWITVSQGTTTGIHAATDLVWMDLPFPEPVDLGYEVAVDRFRFGFRNMSGVNKVWYSSPNPLAVRGFSKLRDSDGLSAIQPSGVDVSVCFRVLGLVADDGVDFLGNPYRSAVRSNVAGNTNTVDGATEDAVYMSEPSPSRFAVKNLYYDVRQPTPITYGKTNFAVDPSFEIPTSWWTQLGGTFFARETTWTGGIGTYSAHFTSGALGINAIAGLQSPITDITVESSQTYTFAALFQILGQTGTGNVRVRISWYDNAAALISSADGNAQSTGTGVYSTVSALSPNNARTARLEILAHGGTGGGSIDFRVDSVQMVKETTRGPYFDGTMPGFRWTGTLHNSFSVATIEPTISDDLSVIDNILVDPVTPGVWFNVYYSTDGDTPTTEAEWENKLWTRVTANYQATKREAHKFPSPVLAKFMKVEFTHLQARSYNPGDFAKPVSYKKHPKWVLDYFLARLDSEQQLADRLLPGRIAVVYDALDLAYNYYLDDLRQEPNKPIEVDPSFTSTTSSFLRQRGDLSDQIDSIMLDKINLAMKPYQDHPSTFSKPDYIVGELSVGTVDGTIDYPSEKVTVPRTDVGSLRNENVVFESDYPVMFFYLTCRHHYREVIAPFTHDRAYFVGVREIAFTRDQYTSAFDQDQYMEPAGDLLNVERNDFFSDNGTLTVEQPS